MTSINLTASPNVSGAVQGVQQVTRTVKDLEAALKAAKNAASGVGGSISQEAADAQATVAAARKQVDDYLNNTIYGRRQRANMRRTGVTPGQEADAILNGTQGHLGSTAANTQRIRNGILQNAGVVGQPGTGGGIGGVAGDLISRYAGPAIIGAGLYNGVKRNENQYIEFDRMMRGTGTDAGSFDSLLRSTREDTPKGQDYSEHMRDMDTIAKSTGERDFDSLSKSASTAAGFGRSVGIDMGRSANAFGALLHDTGGHGDTDTRRIAVLIGETIANTGMWAKADEMLSAFVSSAGSMVSRTLMAANLAPMASFLTAANETHLPGLMGAAGASLFNQMDQSFSAGGSKGEAGQVYLYNALANANPNLRSDPYKMQALRQGGLGASSQSILGEGSDVTNFETVMKSFNLKDMTKGKGDWWRKADQFGNLFGMNSLQASGMMEAGQHLDGQQQGGLIDLIKRMKLPMEMIAPTGFAGLGKMLKDAGGNASKVDLDAAKKVATEGMASTLGSVTLDNDKTMINLLTESTKYLADVKIATEWLATATGMKVLSGGRELVGAALDGMSNNPMLNGRLSKADMAAKRAAHDAAEDAQLSPFGRGLKNVLTLNLTGMLKTDGQVRGKVEIAKPAGSVPRQRFEQ